MRRALSLTFGCILANAAIAGDDAPVEVRLSELSPTIQALHAPCALPRDVVSVATEKYGAVSVVAISCPRDGAASWPEQLEPRFDETISAETPVAIYVVKSNRDDEPARVLFPVRLDDGREAEVDTLPASAAAAHAEGDREGDQPWVEALWKPLNQPDMCKIRATWRLDGGKAELWRWAEAPRCTDDGPQYETKIDRGVPRLVVE